MRAITPAQQAVLDAGVQADHVRLWVKDSGGTFRDLTTYPGFNALISVQWKADINSPHATFEAQLKRELYSLSLAPLMQDSALNRGFNPSAPYGALLAKLRDVKIDVAVVPFGEQPESGDWMTVFTGRIGNIDAASGPNIVIRGLDMSGRLQRAQITRERVYAFAIDPIDGGKPVACLIWQPEMVVEEGDYVIPASRGAGSSGGGPADPGYNKFFKVDTPGTTGTEEPTWLAGDNILDGTASWDYIGAPTTAGLEVEKVIQLILDGSTLGPGAVPLITEGDPDWLVGQFMQQRGPLGDAARNLAIQNGWDLRERWNDDAEDFRYTMYEPNRDDPDVDHVFSAREYGEPTALTSDVADLRNEVDVIFEDKGSLWPDGSTARKTVTARNQDSIDELGEVLWAEIQEDQNSHIDTPEEAERFAASFISDCSNPDATMAVPLMRGFPWAVLNDFYTFAADGRRFDTDQSQAVTSISQTYQGGKLKTELQCRGKPTLGARVQIRRISHPRNPAIERPHRTTNFQGDTTASARIDSIVGGNRITVELDLNKQRLVEEYEHHIYETPGTPLSSDTLATITKSRTIEVAHLNPGAAYVHRVVPRTYNAEKLVRGQPSVEQTFVAGRGQAGHLRQEVEWGRMPLNGGFETFTDGEFGPGTLRPDHWKLTNNAPVECLTGDEGVSGNGYVFWNFRFDNDPAAEMLTELPFTVERGVSYDVAWWAGTLAMSVGPADGALELAVRWYDFEQNVISDSTVDLISCDVERYQLRGTQVTAPDDARFGAIVVKANTLPSGAYRVYIDSVRLSRA